MPQEKTRERRRAAVAVATAAQQQCPWCRGRLELKPSFPIRAMIPGDVRARGEEHIPEALRTIRAWVCATPHCRYRESA
jgi:hypothetical protein